MCEHCGHARAVVSVSSGLGNNEYIRLCYTCFIAYWRRGV